LALPPTHATLPEQVEDRPVEQGNEQVQAGADLSPALALAS